MNAKEIETITGVIIDDDATFTLTDICRVTNVDPDLVVQLVEYHVIKPIGPSRADWQFDCVSLKRIRLARTFHHDLEVNLPGVALLLEMLERIDQLEAELSRSR